MNLKKLLAEEPVIVAGAANLAALTGVLTSAEANTVTKAVTGIVAAVVTIVSTLHARRNSKPLPRGKHEVGVATPGGHAQADEKAAP